MSIISVLILIAALVFSILNRGNVSVDLWPLTRSFEIPLFLIAIVPLIVGYSIGRINGWLRSSSYKKKMKHSSKELEELHEKIKELKD